MGFVAPEYFMKKFFVFSLLLGLFGYVSAVQAAIPPHYTYNGRDYYLVDSNNPNANSGDRVCAMVGKPCVGYTGLTTAICKYFHPDANVTQSVNGSKAGFYCDNGPNSDLACQNMKNNCQICPACDVGLDCTTQIGSHFREAYVQCGDASSTTTNPKSPVVTPAAPLGNTFWQQILNWFQSFWHGVNSGWHALTSWVFVPGPSAPGGSTTTHPNPAPVQGSKLPAEICANGGECKSGNCVRDDQGVYRCSCSNLSFSVTGCK